MLFAFLSFFAFWGWEGAAWTDGSSWLCVVCRVACVVLVLAVVESDLALALFLQRSGCVGFRYFTRQN